MTVLEWTAVKNFRIEEFTHPDKMSRTFVQRLDRARSFADMVFVITSSYRKGAGSHSEGLAVDIAVKTSRDRFKIVESLIFVGFARIGVYDNHIHVDDSHTLDKDVLWIGSSQ